jgi:ribose transport system substrate-binding protein
MKNKLVRGVAIGASVAMALSLSACGRSGAEGEGDAGTVSLAVSTLNNPFFIQLRDGAQAAADEAGINLEVVDAQNDASVQQNQMTNAATQGVDVAIINPVDSNAAAAAVTPLINGDIPVIAVDRTVEGQEVASTVSSDNVAGGRQAADALAEAIGEEGDVIVLQGVPGTSASRDRGAGFAEGIEAYPNINVVASQPANFDRAQGLDVATNLLQSHPDVVAIFAENDEMALGAIQALGDRAGKDVFVFGFDGTEGAMSAIQEGTLHGTIAQQPAELGRKAIELALKLMNGEEVDSETPVEVKTVTAENVEEFMN